MTEQKIAPRVMEVVQQDQGILKTFNMQVVHAWDGVCEIVSQIPANMVNASGFAHGSIAFSMMDTACAYALGSTERRGVTVHGDTTYVRGGVAGSTFKARVQIASASKRVATLRGEVFVQLDVEETDNSESSVEWALAAHGAYVFQLRVED